MNQNFQMFNGMNLQNNNNMMMNQMNMNQMNNQMNQKGNQESTLYVGDLDEQIQEEMLQQEFSKHGQVAYVRIMKEKETGKSRGFAFVAFQNKADAEKAQEKLNGVAIVQNKIRVCQYNSAIDKTANVYIKGVDQSTSIPDLKAEFGQFGSVFSIKVGQDKEGQTLGYGYVQFMLKEDSLKAIQAKTVQVNNQTIVIEEFVKKGERKETLNNLYIKNLPKQSEDKLKQDLETYCSKFGKIVSVMVKLDKKSELPFAFVCFEDKDQAQKAYDALKDQDVFVSGQPLFVNWAQSKSARENHLRDEFNKLSSLNLYTKNLLETVEEEDLKKIFESTYGELASIAVMFPKTTPPNNGPKTKQAFFSFKNKEDAEKAISESQTNEELSKLYLDNKCKLVKHQNKQQRQQRQNNSKMNKNNQQNMMQMMQQMFSNPMFFQQMMMMMPMMNQGMMMNNRPGQMRNMPNMMQMGGGQQMRPQMPNMNNMNMGMMNIRPQNNMHMQQQQVQQQPQPVVPQQPKFTPQTLKANIDSFLKYDADKQRAILGELIFPLVQKHASASTQAPKITGMLIDFEVFEVTEILEFLENQELLKERISEAEDLIQNTDQ